MIVKTELCVPICSFQVNAFPITVMFGMCSIFLFMAAILQRRLMSVAESHKSSSKLSCHNLIFRKLNLFEDVFFFVSITWEKLHDLVLQRGKIGLLCERLVVKTSH
jgi:hypothetical protein